MPSDVYAGCLIGSRAEEEWLQGVNWSAASDLYKGQGYQPMAMIHPMIKKYMLATRRNCSVTA